MVAVEIHDYLVSIVSIGKTETTLTLCYVLWESLIYESYFKKAKSLATYKDQMQTCVKIKTIECRSYKRKMLVWHPWV